MSTYNTMSKSIIKSLTKLLENPNSTVGITREPELEPDFIPYFYVTIFDEWTKGIAKEFMGNSLEAALKSACRVKAQAEAHSPEGPRAACEEIAKETIRGNRRNEELRREICNLKKERGYLLADLPHTVDGLPIIVGKTTVFFSKLFEFCYQSGVVFYHTTGINCDRNHVRVQLKTEDRIVGDITIPLSECYSTAAAWLKGKGF